MNHTLSPTQDRHAKLATEEFVPGTIRQRPLLAAGIFGFACGILIGVWTAQFLGWF